MDRDRTQAPSADAGEAYVRKLRAEAEYWALTELDYERQEALVPRPMKRWLNAELTGSPELDWFDELVGRGPFHSAAQLGSSSGWLEQRWLDGGCSDTLDVYELSTGVLDKARARLSGADLLARARLIPADLNVVELPRNHYDVIWGAGVLHHLVGLEHLFDQIALALKPGGLFAFFEYVGEKRLQFVADRLRLCEEALASVPDAFWRNGRVVKSADLDLISPFEAVRSDEIHVLASARFRVLHWAQAAPLGAPAFAAVDFMTLAEQMPHELEKYLAAERQSAASGLGGSVGYAVFQRRD
jgi:SAM-dependent methyltransferase